MRPVYLVVMAVLFFVAGCGSRIQPEAPPAIAYGEDICDQCGMIISDERFAAGAVVEVAPNDYEQRKFDDIGGLFRYVSEHRDLDFVTLFVHDYNSTEWIDAHRAYFVVADAWHTPMGYGIAACVQRSEAEALAAEWQGKVLSFDDAQTELAHVTPGVEHQHSP